MVVLREQTGKHPKYVFSFRGKPITQVSTKAWYAALERAGIENFRQHDLRHYAEFRIMPSSDRADGAKRPQLPASCHVLTAMGSA